MLDPKLARILNWARIVVVVSVALFFLSLLVPIYGEICGPNEYTHAKECSQYHAGPFVLVWIANVVDRHNGLVTAIATVFLTILTGLLTYLARLQYTTNLTQLSAFVFVEDFRALFEIDPTIPQPADPVQPRNVSGWAFRPIFRNSGETQTRNMAFHADCEFRDRPLPPKYPFPDNNTTNARMLLGPKAAATGGSPRTFTVAELREVQAGTKFLYIWGWIRYENVFQRHKTHVTRYCAQVSVVTDPSKATGTFQYPIPNDGNCSDDECVAMGLP